MSTMLIRKTDHLGREKTRYPGTIISRDSHKIVLACEWPNLPVVSAYGVEFNPGDALIEHFYFDRWCNVMAIYGPRVHAAIDPESLKGWYCNITRPTILRKEEAGNPAEIEWQDLALDVWMSAQGDAQILDEDEFEAIKPDLSPMEVASALGAVPDTIEICRNLWRDNINDRIAAGLTVRKWTVATAESCTGGLIGDALTNRAGSSAYFMGGVLSYDNRIKRDVLHVPQSVLDGVGAVSEECALAMARGVRTAIGADVGVSATGIAGPGGATPGKPVGLVFIGLSTPTEERVERFVWPHDRIGNKRASADAALRMLARLD